jgi:DNA repair exonuclease SbcCD nuclease subunit
MTTIAHISDTHLGNRQYGSDTRREDFIDAFEAAVAAAIDAEADAIIHTGDLFHRRTPPLPEVNECIRILRRAADAEIPFHAIVGNHDRKMDDQWLDLIEHTGTASRLDQSPTIVGGDGEDDPTIALYGIDAVPAPAWDATDFALEAPPEKHADAYRLLCMHQLLSPPVPEIMADYPTEAVIERLDTEIDGLALGDYHESESATVAGVDAWYSGSTERGSAGEAAPRSITLLQSTDDGGFSRTHHELDTRPFRTIDIDFGEDDGRAHARDVIQNHDLSEAVAVVTLTGKRTSLTAGGVHDLLIEQGAAVGRVDDSRGREHLDVDLSEAPSAAVEDADTLIGERLAEADFSEATLAVEAEVRGESTATNSLDSTAEELISEAQEAAFSAGGPDPADILDSDGPDIEADAEADADADAIDDTEADTEPDADAEADDTDAEPDEEADREGDDADTEPEADGEAPDAAPESPSPTDESGVTTDESPDRDDSPDSDDPPGADESTDSDDPPDADDVDDTGESTDADDADTENDSTDTTTTASAGSSNQTSLADLMAEADDDTEDDSP